MMSVIDTSVAAWAKSVDAEDLFISTVTWSSVVCLSSARAPLKAPSGVHGWNSANLLMLPPARYLL
ncbi:hypothetical protein [Pseudomonas aeruginosa]|uniref:hypothetical protein n=1 Tax=Pseudomonas aeruginosa TaxID=287 RepID=UPI00070F5B0F|nr:hypothetical protein [Pseudomonas aeruginosa]NNB83658.1 type II toxin-antitoxin system VapC family toxin [Pseudomonas aeruginosa]RUB28870.1 hypothetical protein IPC1432_21750 [Pseudomonas aeruginosa]HCD7569734.1 hypothetical protein [Pseudomonas aeruginosa]HCZ9132578.1 hypothetical protein [Pseudomonas aeruginosa]HDQ4736113.1 hypothetical protein [Pseudomonas aeruginosa]